jgi:hypothetical protein
MSISIVLQWAAIISVLAGCLFVLSAMPAKTAAGFSRDQLQSWMSVLGASRVGWLVRFNIAGALLSFATVVLFFVGNAALFGVFTVAAILSLGVGAFVTKALSGAIAKLPEISTSLAHDSPAKATLAAIVWTPSTWGKRTSELVRCVSLGNLFGVLWLEFAFMSDMGGRLMGLAPLERVGLLFLASFVVLYACFRFGVRGIAFLDLILTPLIFLGVLILLVGALSLPVGPQAAAATPAWLEPKLPSLVIALFVVHVFCLNPFLLVVTEGHWFRMWAFGQPELKQQVPGLTVVAVVSAMLVAVGLLGGTALPGEPGDALIARLLTTLDTQLPVFAAAFWVAGVAAMFSTADVQILGIALMTGFRRDTGTSNLASGILNRPTASALIVATALALLYYAVRIAIKVDFEKLIFFILPAAITLLPALMFRLTRASTEGAHFAVVMMGFFGYLIVSLIGLARPADQLGFNLAAVLIPVVISAGIWLTRPKHKNTGA